MFYVNYMDKVTTDERSLINEIKRLISQAIKKGKLLDVWKVLPTEEGSINLASIRFQEFWKEWWDSNLIPQLEIDFILVLEEEVPDLGKPCLLGVEVKYFRSNIKMNFYEGLDQSLAYLRVGLDKSALLHIFHPEFPNELVEKYSKAMEVLVRGLELPIAYVACRIKSLENLGKFTLYTYYSHPTQADVTLIVHFLKRSPINPLLKHILYNDEVKLLRATLMAKLEIPRL